MATCTSPRGASGPVPTRLLVLAIALLVVQVPLPALAIPTFTPTPTASKTGSATETVPFEPTLGELVDHRTIVIDIIQKHSQTATPDSLLVRSLRFVEEAVLATPGFSGFCLKNLTASFESGDCDPFLSVTQIATPDMNQELQKPEYRMNRGALNPEPTFTEDGLIVTGNYNYKFVRTIIRFGGPLSGYTTRFQGEDEQEAVFTEFFLNTLGRKLKCLQEDYEANSNFHLQFRGRPFQVEEALWGKFRSEAALLTTTNEEKENFAYNLKKLEYLATIKPGTYIPDNLNPFMHFNRVKFLLKQYNLADNEDPASSNTFLMFNSDPELFDYAHPIADPFIDWSRMKHLDSDSFQCHINWPLGNYTFSLENSGA